MKKFMLIPAVALVATFGSPFASAAMAAEKAAEAAHVCKSEESHAAHCIDTKKGHICLLEKRGVICEHAEK